MDDGYLLPAGDRDVSAPITNMSAQSAHAAPSAGWRARRFGYSNWRDPHRWRSSRRVTFSFYKSRIRMQQGNK